MVNFLLFISLIAFIISIVGLFKGNLKRFNLHKRRHIAILTVATFVFMGILSPSAEEDEDDLGEEPVIEDVAAEDEQAEEEELDEEENQEVEEADEGQDEQEAKKEEEQEDEAKKEKKTEEENKSSKNLENLKAHFINVGQADASFIEFEAEGETYNILIDAGDWNRNDAVNYLQHLGISHIDLAVGTHPHADHIGQLDEVIENFSVDEVWMSGDSATSQVFDRVLTAIDNNNVNYHEPRAGETYDMGPLQIDVVHPASVSGDLNNGSIVMKLIYGNIALLFTGDAEKEAESSMISRGENLSAEVLKVGHHGSDTSSTQQFVESVNPEVAIISASENNQYGHPSEAVVDRYKNLGVDLYATKDHGTVIVETDGLSYDVTTGKDGNVTPASTGASKGSSKKSSSSSETNQTKKSSSGDCIDINSASLDEVQQIIHIGPARAEELIDLRPFNKVEDLTKINGIGDARIDDIKAEGIACVK